MKLVYRGIKYNSNSLIALKIVRQHKHKIGLIISKKKFDKSIIGSRFPFFEYAKQLFSTDPYFVRNPRVFLHQYLARYLEKCWKVSEVKILDSCWKITLEKEKESVNANLPIKLKYRGVTYYK